MTPRVVRETAMTFECQGERLLGVLSSPESAGATPELGVVIVVGGPQVRAGSHRQFVQLARHLATQGLPVLRFDTRGMGDSTGPLCTFETLAPDIGAAIDGLVQSQPSIRHVALWGLCDGASAALLYMDEVADPRVAALCLANPWVRSEATLARTQVRHYYRQRLLQREFWLKLLSGRVAASAWSSFIVSLRTARRGPDAEPAEHFRVRMARAWRRFDGPILLLLSGQDYTAREFLDVVVTDPAWRGTLDRPGLARQDLPEADHTFSDAASRRGLEHATGTWLAQGMGAARSKAPASPRVKPWRNRC